ncbi:endolytic transglycosylase MltG [Terrisporobacter mayombei]|uniref:Endolytic murein transglycosylase n=1 Tax=Terrisporobacter mayombei TaxID=1541 RepID=A0ABY9Q2U3_9FIRM|nr:endolytic transglycosylase MltG [Terrisporobacter mayombei]MCC3867259.1 endolytic transglycosylase MltG [Terrisporobacter mayombei]WMT81521.1 Endolytic murein transglycosylase [Terrisporobacter mayombei]
MNLNNDKSKKIVVFIIAVLILIIVATFVVIQQIGPYNKANKEDIVIDIPTGSALSQVTDILKENNLIKNKTLFKLYVRVSNNSSKLKSGKYLFNQTYSNKEIIEDLSEGKVYNEGIKITVPEGSTSFEIMDILVKNKLGEKSAYEKLINNPTEFKEKFKFLDDEKIKSLEGFLYPSTYYFSEKQSEKEVLEHMLETFDSKYTDKLQKKQKELNKSLYEVVNLASIVEKEAVLDEDRPIIASVFYNRIKIDMPLQSDATIQYIFKERKKSITYNDLKIDSPYNTYKVAGLPPTPIANPGIKSIEAVLYPDNTEYLYFVATIEGGNTYSKTYEEHVKNVEKYRKDREERNNSYSTDK